MSMHCQEPRERWLEDLAKSKVLGTNCHNGGDGGDEPEKIAHLESCPECAEWVRRNTLLARALWGLPSLSAPPELATRLFPLERSVAAADPEVSPVIQAVRALDRHPAPAVLERLVAEELADPSAARTRRFAGDLEPLPAPRKLEVRVLAELRRRIRPRRLLGPVATLAAAAVLVWVGLNQFGGAPESSDHRYSFTVQHPESLEGLPPMALRIAEVVGGSSRRGG